MDEENKNRINEGELEQVSGGTIRHIPKKCPKCKKNNALLSKKCKYCGAKLK